jgi:hypothetical protein
MDGLHAASFDLRQFADDAILVSDYRAGMPGARPAMTGKWCMGLY